MQSLQAQIQIPSDLVLVSKVEYESLLNNTLEGKFLTLKQLAEHIGCSTSYLKSEILYNPRYKDILKDFVYYPSNSGEHWRIKAKEMYKFLDSESIKIFLKKKY